MAKRANLDRIKEFSRNLQSFNRQAISQQPSKLPPSAEKHDIALSQQKHSSRRQKALDFAKNVPKPRVAANSNNNSKQHQQQNNRDYCDGEEEDGGYGNGFPLPGSSSGTAGMELGTEFQHESRLLELEARHNNSKAQIDAIRRNLGLK